MNLPVRSLVTFRRRLAWAEEVSRLLQGEERSSRVEDCTKLLYGGVEFLRLEYRDAKEGILESRGL